MSQEIFPQASLEEMFTADNGSVTVPMQAYKQYVEDSYALKLLLSIEPHSYEVDTLLDIIRKERAQADSAVATGDKETCMKSHTEETDSVKPAGEAVEC